MPGKEVKATLIYFTQNCVSMFLFSTSEQSFSTSCLEECARTVILYMACLFFFELAFSCQMLQEWVTTFGFNMFNQDDILYLGLVSSHPL